MRKVDYAFLLGALFGEIGNITALSHDPIVGFISFLCFGLGCLTLTGCYVITNWNKSDRDPK